jgi:hypothetical protein
MYTLMVKGARRATLAIHHLDSYTDLCDLLEVYRALGYGPDALVVMDEREKAA